MQIKKGLLLTALTVLSAPTMAAIWVDGRSRTVNEFGAGQSSSYSDYVVSYEDKSIPWGADIELVSGLRCLGQGGAGAWQYQRMTAVAPYTWQLQTRQTTADKYRGYCYNFEFAVRVTLPDGRQYFDNGGRSPTGFYSVGIPSQGQDFQSMTVQAMASANEYRR